MGFSVTKQRGYIVVAGRDPPWPIILELNSNLTTRNAGQLTQDTFGA